MSVSDLRCVYVSGEGGGGGDVSGEGGGGDRVRVRVTVREMCDDRTASFSLSL